MSVERILEFTYSTQEALFGVVTATFATFVFPFMIFGAFLERSGAGGFFMNLGTAVAGRWRGGPAKIAVITSALFGSISGSSAANVVPTGRSEERRVGKECVSTCRSRWSLGHQKQK